MKTEYSFVVNYNNHSSVLFVEDSLENGLGRAIDYAAYYTGLEYPNISIEVESQCAECQNTGQVVSKRSGRVCKFKKCPQCKGKFDGMKLSIPVDIEGNIREAKNSL